jgi:hypothetical protein
MTWHRNHLTDDQIEAAKIQYAAGERMSHIARALGVRPDWLKCLIDPAHHAKRCRTRRESARARRRLQPKLPKVHHPEVYAQPVIPDHVLFEQQQAFSRPQPLSAYLMGDPLPGRSALDRMAR